MAYPNHNLSFHIYTNASNYQMGAISHYHPTNTSCCVLEKELLSIVMVLEELHSMLLGTELFIYTDHKNLTFAMLNCRRVLRWWSYVE
ncbi:hypothetical protein ACHAXS_000185 [Conticribra weissflogii]